MYYTGCTKKNNPFKHVTFIYFQAMKNIDQQYWTRFNLSIAFRSSAVSLRFLFVTQQYNKYAVACEIIWLDGEVQ